MATSKDKEREREMMRLVDKYLEPKVVSLRNAVTAWVSSTKEVQEGTTAASVLAQLTKEHLAIVAPVVVEDGELKYEDTAMGIFLRVPISGDMGLLKQVSDLAPPNTILNSDSKVMKVRIHLTAGYKEAHVQRAVDAGKETVGQFLDEVVAASKDTWARARNTVVHTITAHIKALTEAPGIEGAMLKLGIKKADPRDDAPPYDDDNGSGPRIRITGP